MTITLPTHRALTATVFFVNFRVALDMSLVNIALPSIRSDLGFTESGLQCLGGHRIGRRNASALVSGIVNSARQLGGTIGLAVLVTLASTFDAPRDGYRMGFAVGAVFLVVGSLAAWAILSDRDSVERAGRPRP
ncbi:hypothetical protein [Gordonia iterans]